LRDDIIKKLKKIRGPQVKTWRTIFNKDELNLIISSVSHLDIEVDAFAEIRHCYIENISKQPFCPNCGKKLSYIVKEKRYKYFCSQKCRLSDVGKTHYKNKLKETNLERYGVENIFQNEKIKKIIKKTNLERYGVENVMSLEHIKQKIKETNLERYGVEYWMLDSDLMSKSKANWSNSQRRNYWDSLLILLKRKQIKPLFTKDEYINYDYNVSFKEYKCLKCGKTFRDNNLNPHYVYCPHHKYRSQAEYDIESWLSQENSNLKIIPSKKFSNNGKRFELDLYLPELNIGIEYHGLYWHSEARKKKNYHKNKYEFFKNLGISLIQIFESEWIHKKEIVKSILRTKLGVVERKVYGRSCTIRSIENDEYKQFCELNHIQGYCSANVKLGLYDKTGELVQIMSFSKPRFNKSYDWENIRTCTLLNTIVVGGFSKILKYFKNNYPGSIISYVDLRYFNGNGYINNGFELINQSKPNFFYWKVQDDNYILESRQKYQKHKLSKILDNYDPKITAHDNMLQNKYLRIYDAGNLVLIFK